MKLQKVMIQQAEHRMRLEIRLKALEKNIPKLSQKRIKDAEFFNSRAWMQVRYRAFKKSEGRCEACHRRGVVLQIDHIKPRSKYPELALVESNLQILCKDCNLGKGAWDQTDWRKDHPETRGI